MLLFVGQKELFDLCLCCLQGPPGQMAYAHFEDHDEVIVSTKLGTNPEELADFILGSVVKSHEDAVQNRSGSHQELQSLIQLEGGESISSTTGGEVALISHDQGSIISPLDASTKALKILRDTVLVVEKHVRTLQALDLSAVSTVTTSSKAGKQSLPHITTPEIMKRYNAVTTNSPRSGRRPAAAAVGAPQLGGGKPARARSGSSGGNPLLPPSGASASKQYDSMGASGRK